jgi:hypothetical protein
LPNDDQRRFDAQLDAMNAAVTLTVPARITQAADDQRVRANLPTPLHGTDQLVTELKRAVACLPRVRARLRRHVSSMSFSGLRQDGSGTLSCSRGREYCELLAAREGMRGSSSGRDAEQSEGATVTDDSSIPAQDEWSDIDTTVLRSARIWN